MTHATLKVTGINTPENANKLLWLFQDAFKRNAEAINIKKGYHEHAWRYSKTKTNGNLKD